MVDTLRPGSLEEVNEQLDTLLVQQLELVQDYINLSLENERQMKDGFSHIARARYSTGSQPISKACFPTEDVEQDFLADVTVIKSPRNERCLQVSTIPKTGDDYPTKDESYKRIAGQFGVLKSPSLKLAEARFHTCLNQVVDRVNTLSELENIREKYASLIKQKKKLEMLQAREM